VQLPDLEYASLRTNHKLNWGHH